MAPETVLVDPLEKSLATAATWPSRTARAVTSVPGKSCTTSARPGAVSRNTSAWSLGTGVKRPVSIECQHHDVRRFRVVVQLGLSALVNGKQLALRAGGSEEKFAFGIECQVPDVFNPLQFSKLLSFTGFIDDKDLAFRQGSAKSLPALSNAREVTSN